MNHFEEGFGDVANANKAKEKTVAKVAETASAAWLDTCRSGVPGLMFYVAAGIGAWCALVLAVVTGTALGNGVPMARSASVAFSQGVQTGLKECPCAKNKAAARNASPTPLALQPARSAVRVAVKEDSPSPGKQPVQLLKPEPILIEPLKAVSDVFNGSEPLTLKPEPERG